jgi:hypothetical protein
LIYDAGHYDTDAFAAVTGCTTKFTLWSGPLLVGGYTYDRHNKSTVWIKINNWLYTDVREITC